jgi:UDP:flavonoid glycosyltransferase YjiC (YdhE family)
VDHVGVKAMITVVPVAGHVGPISGLVAELVSRGHQVRVYTGSRYRRRFSDLGATVVTWSAAQDFDEDNIGATFPLARRPGLLRVLALVRQGFIGTAPGQVRDLNQELEREPADILVADSMSFGGVLTGELRGLPWALLNVLPFNQSFESGAAGFQVKPARGALGRLRDRLLRLAYRAVTYPFKRAYNQARAEIGLPRDRRPYGSVLFSDWLVLATGCPSLDVPRPDLPEQVHFVGQVGPAGAVFPGGAGDGTPRLSASVDRRPLVIGGVMSETRFSFRKERRRHQLPGAPREQRHQSVVVVTQGTHDVEPADLIEPALKGLANAEVEVIATSGRRGRTDVGLAPLANARVVDLIDFASVLPKAAVFVTNGGWGGVLASLAAGVPLVVAPGSAADKPAIAARVARSGAGINLRKRRPKPDAVADAVRDLLTHPSYRERARQIGSELDQLGGASAAADLLERLAETRAPLRRTGDPWSSPAKSG